MSPLRYRYTDNQLCLVDGLERDDMVLGVVVGLYPKDKHE